ncbi:hypothetical protein QZH41_003219 [Actinostola sp. cb2023]|nr:hypothetical protein QZH41_003219 [Actinostola sp. cb2023]
MYEEMKAKYINLKFHEGLPDSPYDLFASHERPGILFFDDLMGELTEKETKKKMEQWFTRGSHHHDITLMLMSLTRQAFPQHGDRVKRAYQAIKDTPYQPLVLDFQQKTPDEFRVRTVEPKH